MGISLPINMVPIAWRKDRFDASILQTCKPKVENVATITPLTGGCQIKGAACRGKVRSSYCSKVESSCWEPSNWRDEKTGDAGDEREGAGSVEGVA